MSETTKKISMEFYASQFLAHRVDLIDLSDYPRFVKTQDDFDRAFQQLSEKIPDHLRADLEQLEELALMLRAMSAEGYYLQGVADLLHFMAQRPPTPPLTDS